MPSGIRRQHTCSSSRQQNFHFHFHFHASTAVKRIALGGLSCKRTCHFCTSGSVRGRVADNGITSHHYIKQYHSPLPKAFPEQKYTSSNFVPSGYSQSTFFPPPPAATAVAASAMAAVATAPQERGSNRASPPPPRALLPLPLPELPSRTKGSRARGASRESVLLAAAQHSANKTAVGPPPPPLPLLPCWPLCDANLDSWSPTAAMLAEPEKTGSGGRRARVEGDEPRRALRRARFMAECASRQVRPSLSTRILNRGNKNELSFEEFLPPRARSAMRK